MKLTEVMTPIAGWLRELGPYAAIGLIVPGGSLIALAMWAWRHRSADRNLSRVLTVVAVLAAALVFPRGD